MGAVREEVRVVREVLESTLSHDVASRVMFEALAGRTMPRDADDVLVFVRGPLALRLVAQVGAETASHLVSQLDSMLVRHATTGSFYDVDVEVDELGGGEPSVTKAMALSFQAPVPVLVAAGTDRLAGVLEISL